MKFIYDPLTDSLYINLTGDDVQISSHPVDDDIVLDFAVPERLVGIGVRQASKRLDLDHLLPHAEVLRREEALWPRLRGELLRRKTADEPVKTLLHGVAYWVQEVGPDYVYLRTDRGRGKSHRINADEIQDKNTEKYVGKRRLIYALRAILD